FTRIGWARVLENDDDRCDQSRGEGELAEATARELRKGDPGANRRRRGMNEVGRLQSDEEPDDGGSAPQHHPLLGETDYRRPRKRRILWKFCGELAGGDGVCAECEDEQECEEQYSRRERPIRKPVGDAIRAPTNDGIRAAEQDDENQHERDG